MNRHEKQEVESGLRNLLEEMMIFSNEKISGIEHCNCQDLIQRISKQFRQLKNSNLEYKKLESVLQQQEADIRNHISLQSRFTINLPVEQQMKLYQDGLQSKLEEANQEVKRLQSEVYKLKKSKYEQKSKKKDQSHDGSTSYRQGSPKKQSSFSQHGGYASHRSSCDELFKRYNKLLQQQQASISQRSNTPTFIAILRYYQIGCNIQISQYMMKGRQTLAEIVNIQPSRSQTKHNSSSVNKSGYNNSINSEAIRNLLKMK